MFWLMFLSALFLTLHFLVLAPTQLAITAAAVLTAILWVIWKLKWILLAIFGVEELFGGRGNDL
jgi:hypothetical protein